MREDLQIRLTESSELANLRALAEETFVQSFGHQNTIDDMKAYVGEAFTIDHITKEYHDPHSRFFFATMQEEVIGYLKINVESAQNESLLENAMEIERIYVKADFQGNQVGRRLLSFVMDLASKEHYSFVWLGVWDQNHRAIEFYQKNGFEVFSSHQFLLGQDEQTDMLMKKAVS